MRPEHPKPSSPRPLIGITVGTERERADDLKIAANYLRAIDQAGGAPVLVPPVEPEALEAILSRLDGIVLPGGPDVDPAAYGAVRHPQTRPNRDLDRLELAVARRAVLSNRPILGICRGQQLVNVALGGTLVQHLTGHVRQPGWALKWPRPPEPSHHMRVAPDSRLAAMLGTTDLVVNSFHHQAVLEPGAALRPVAWAPDGTVEALESTRHPWLVTVQFHPEEMVARHLPSRRLMAAFVEACVRSAGGLAAVPPAAACAG